MKTKKSRFPALSLAAMGMIAMLNAQPSTIFAQGTAFTYQGKLTSGTTAANGIYDFRFAVYDLAGGGSQQGAMCTTNGVAVTNGYFIAMLDFGNQFDGGARWLEIGVRTNGGGAFTTLNPRQPLTPAPYAIYAPTAGTASVAASVTAGSITSTALGDNSITAAKLASDAGSLSKVTAGTMTMNGDSPQLNSHDLLLKNDDRHGLGYYYGTKLFGGVGVDGPVLYGYSGGGLGTKTYSASNLALVWNTLGNVGIGTHNPAAKLDVFDGSYHLRFTGDAIGFSAGDSPGYVYCSDPGGRLDFVTGGRVPQDSNASLLLLNNLDAIFNGNVGIGILTPSAKLEVQGGPIKATGGLIIETRTSDPPSPAVGQIWLRTDL